MYLFTLSNPSTSSMTFGMLSKLRWKCNVMMPDMQCHALKSLSCFQLLSVEFWSLFVLLHCNSGHEAMLWSLDQQLWGTCIPEYFSLTYSHAKHTSRSSKKRSARAHHLWLTVSDSTFYSMYFNTVTSAALSYWQVCYCGCGCMTNEEV